MLNLMTESTERNRQAEAIKKIGYLRAGYFHRKYCIIIDAAGEWIVKEKGQAQFDIDKRGSDYGY